ncbi:hypothetical protein [Streptococcus devriesei]|uniref:hypothetical protein n=1 Tax=Streptococcus devriesei TaxID=231233 RepID=UPI00041B27CC|nr:hypothetical protein [Streptococcus devriesei]
MTAFLKKNRLYVLVIILSAIVAVMQLFSGNHSGALVWSCITFVWIIVLYSNIKNTPKK